MSAVDGGAFPRGRTRLAAVAVAITASVTTLVLLLRAFGGVGGMRDVGGSGRVPGAADVRVADAVYELYRPDTEESQIWVVGPGGARPLGVSGISPDLSPAGDAIVFAGDVEEAGNLDIYTVRSDGTGLRRLTTWPHVDTSPAWSPDGRRIVFEREDGEGHAELFVISADGTNERQLTRNDETNDASPAWAPDGRTILFSRYVGENAEIFAVDPQSATLRRLTTSPGYDGGAAWAPDGGRIGFVRDPEEDGSMDLWVMEPDGSGARPLWKVSEPILFVAWSSDGSTLLYVTVGALRGQGEMGGVTLDASPASLAPPDRLVAELEAGWEILGFDVLPRSR